MDLSDTEHNIRWFCVLLTLCPTCISKQGQHTASVNISNTYINVRYSLNYLQYLQCKIYINIPTYIGVALNILYIYYNKYDFIEKIAFSHLSFNLTALLVKYFNNIDIYPLVHFTSCMYSIYILCKFKFICWYMYKL